MNPLDMLQGSTQRWLTYLLVVGFIGILCALIFYPFKLDPTATTLLTALLGSFSTAFISAVNFWFARQRPISTPPPNGASNVQPITTGITVTPAAPK